MWRFHTMLLVGLFGAACGGGGPAAPSQSTSTSTSGTSTTTTIHRDLQYTSSPYPLRLDLHVPPGTTPAPVIVYLHGADGTKEGGGIAQVVFNERTRGYAVASVEYRLPDAPFPASIQDCKAAVRWLRANAATYNLNPNRIGAWGTSFGGYLAALLAVTDGVSALENPGQGSASESSRVQAVVAFSGFFNLAAFPSEPWIVTMLGCDSGNCPDRWAAASPITYVDGSDGPFLLAHGLADTLVPAEQSRLMHQALTSSGVTSTLLLLDGLGHTGAGWTSSAVTGSTEAFLDKYLR